jgi:hypothetical protein
MAYQRLAYDDPASAGELLSDCEAVSAALSRRPRRSRAERTARAAARPAPSILFEDYPREVPKPSIAISEAAARLGAALDQHL